MVALANKKFCSACLVALAAIAALFLLNSCSWVSNQQDDSTQPVSNAIYNDTLWQPGRVFLFLDSTQKELPQIMCAIYREERRKSDNKLFRQITLLFPDYELNGEVMLYLGIIRDDISDLDSVSKEFGAVAFNGNLYRADFKSFETSRTIEFYDVTSSMLKFDAEQFYLTKVDFNNMLETEKRKTANFKLIGASNTQYGKEFYSKLISLLEDRKKFLEILNLSHRHNKLYYTKRERYRSIRRSWAQQESDDKYVSPTEPEDDSKSNQPKNNCIRFFHSYTVLEENGIKEGIRFVSEIINYTCDDNEVLRELNRAEDSFEDNVQQWRKQNGDKYCKGGCYVGVKKGNSKTEYNIYKDGSGADKVIFLPTGYNY